MMLSAAGTHGMVLQCNLFILPFSQSGFGAVLVTAKQPYSEKKRLERTEPLINLGGITKSKLNHLFLRVSSLIVLC